MSFCACGQTAPATGACPCGRVVDLPVPGRPWCAPKGGRLLSDRTALIAARVRAGSDERFGIMAYDVSLVWTRWSGRERGEGTETQLLQMRLVPRPRVEDLSAVSYAGMSGGILPEGSVRISRVSPIVTADNLRGLTIPDLTFLGFSDECGYPLLAGGLRVDQPASWAGLSAREAVLRAAGLLKLPTDHLEQRVSFFYEVQERGGVGERMKFRLASVPFKRRDQMDWTFTLERISEDRTPDGRSRGGLDPDD